MVSNATNINKTNNHFSHQLIEHKMTTTYVNGNYPPCLGQTQKCEGFKLINGIPMLPVLIFGSATAIWIEKTFTDSFPIKKKGHTLS